VPRKKKEKETQSRVRSLDKALNIIELLAQIKEDIDLATLSRQIKLPKSTLLRLLTTLKYHNFVYQDEESRRFQLGWALIYLGKAAEKVFSLPKIIRPYLEKLAEETGETASLVQLSNYRAVYVDQVLTNSVIKGIPQIGYSLGLHYTASGKILLSYLSEDRLNRFFEDGELERKTPKTITDKEKLREEIEKIKRHGYAVDDEETEIGGRCVSAPVFDKDKRMVAAISITGPTSRIKQKDLTALASIVKRIAHEASTALGYSES